MLARCFRRTPRTHRRRSRPGSSRRRRSPQAILRGPPPARAQAARPGALRPGPRRRPRPARPPQPPATRAASRHLTSRAEQPHPSPPSAAATATARRSRLPRCRPRLPPAPRARPPDPAASRQPMPPARPPRPRHSRRPGPRPAGGPSPPRPRHGPSSVETARSPSRRTRSGRDSPASPPNPNVEAPTTVAATAPSALSAPRRHPRPATAAPSPTPRARRTPRPVLPLSLARDVGAADVRAAQRRGPGVGGAMPQPPVGPGGGTGPTNGRLGSVPPSVRAISSARATLCALDVLWAVLPTRLARRTRPRPAPGNACPARPRDRAPGPRTSARRRPPSRRRRDVAVPPLQRAVLRVDLEHVVPALEVVPLVEDVALLEADVAEVAAVPLEDGGEEEMVVVAVDLAARPSGSSSSRRTSASGRPAAGVAAQVARGDGQLSHRARLGRLRRPAGSGHPVRDQRRPSPRPRRRCRCSPPSGRARRSGASSSAPPRPRRPSP